MLTDRERFSQSLKRIARNQDVKEFIQDSSELYPFLMKGAKRFISGDTRIDGINRALQYIQNGYDVSLEFIGENTENEVECNQAMDELKEAIKELAQRKIKGTVSFDLSHIGMMISDNVAASNLEKLANLAEKHQIQLMISMEESEKTTNILSIYHQIALSHSNVGITLQAQLHRSETDLMNLLKQKGKIRLVKGAYQEPEAIYLPRSEQLNNRFIDMVAKCVEANHPLSIATHDKKLLMALKEKGFLNKENVEVEMLDGVQIELLNRLKEEGVSSKVYITYGTEWYLYVLHRLAENPPNIYSFIADMIE